MTYTLLYIHLTLLGTEYAQIVAPFKSATSCGVAMKQILPAVRGDYPEAWGQCTPTAVLSSSPRPKPRPLNLGE